MSTAGRHGRPESSKILHVTAGPDKGRVVAVGSIVEVGRDEDAGLVLHDRLASRRHLRLRVTSFGVVAEDLDSRNGTFVNDARIVRSATLGVGDTLQVGASVLQLTDGETRGVGSLSGGPSHPSLVISPGHRRRRTARKVVLGVLAVLMVVAGAAVDMVVAGRQAPDAGDVSAPAGTQRFAVSTRRHVHGQVAYDQSPPVGGDHAVEPQTCGFYTKPVSSESAVHSLEHGAVWVTYHDDLPAAEVRTLAELVRRNQRVLVSPYDGLPSRVVVSAWGRQLRLDSTRDPRLGQFLRAFVDGPQSPERGETCRGVGAPERRGHER
jgi:pSer/pThr/pTyr-binding forkhead associated (FHA) protein